MKLYEVHFAVKFSKGEAEENLTAKCTKSSSNPMSKQDWQVYLAEHARQGVLGSLGVDIGDKLVKMPSLHSAT